MQRIGLATSGDLIRWEKHPENPLLVADPRWYELLDPDLWHDQAWRDPWIFRHPEPADFTPSSLPVPTTARPTVAVIGHARSDDLIHWEVLPPLTEPGDFGHLEVPQLTCIRGRYYLLFCATASVHSAARRQRTSLEPVTGTHYLVADDPLGPFRF